MQSRDSIENNLLALEDDWDVLKNTVPRQQPAKSTTARLMMTIGEPYDMLTQTTKNAMMKTYANQLEDAHIVRNDLKKYQQRLLATKRLGGLNKNQRGRLEQLLGHTTAKLASADSGIQNLSQRNQALVQHQAAETHRGRQLARFTVDIDHRARQHLADMTQQGATEADKIAYLDAIQAEKAGHGNDVFLLRNHMDPEGWSELDKRNAVTDILGAREDPLGPGSEPILDFGKPIGASLEDYLEQSELISLRTKQRLNDLATFEMDKAESFQNQMPNVSMLHQALKLNTILWKKAKKRKAPVKERQAFVDKDRRLQGEIRDAQRKRKKWKPLADESLAKATWYLQQVRLGKYSKSQFMASGQEFELIGISMDLGLRKRLKKLKAGRREKQGYEKIEEGEKDISEASKQRAAIIDEEARKKKKQAKAAKREAKKLEQKEKQSRKASEKKYKKKRQAATKVRRKKDKATRKQQRKERKAADRKAKKKRQADAKEANKKTNAARNQKKKDKASRDKTYKSKIRQKKKEAKKANKEASKKEKQAKKTRKEGNPSSGGFLKRFRKSSALIRHPLQAAETYEDTMASEDHTIDSFQELLAQKMLDPLSLQAEINHEDMDAEDHEYLHDLFYDYAQEAFNTMRPRTGPTADPVLSLHNVSLADSHAAFDLVSQDIGDELEHAWLQSPETLRAWHDHHAAVKTWIQAIKHQQNWQAHTDPALARAKHIGESSDLAFAMQPPDAIVRKGLYETAANTTKAGQALESAMETLFAQMPLHHVDDNIDHLEFIGDSRFQRALYKVHPQEVARKHAIKRAIKKSEKRSNPAKTYSKQRKTSKKEQRRRERTLRKQHKAEIRAKAKKIKQARKAAKQEKNREYKRARKAQKAREKKIFEKKPPPTTRRPGRKPDNRTIEEVQQDWLKLSKTLEMRREMQKASDASRHPVKAATNYSESVASEDHAIKTFHDLLTQKILEPLSAQADIEDLGMDDEDRAYLHGLFRDYAQAALDTVRPRTGPTADPALTAHNISQADSETMFDLAAHDIGQELEHAWLQGPEAVRGWHTSHAALKKLLTSIKHQQNWQAHTDPALARAKHIGDSSDFAFAMQPSAVVIRKGLHESATNATKAGQSFAVALDRFFSHIPGYGVQ